MIKVQVEDFDLATEYKNILANKTHIGAVVSFIGLVRDFYQELNVNGLFLEHYAGMTENVLNDVTTQASERWQIDDITIIHRVGHLIAGDQIVLILVTGAHRNDAFQACEFLIDYLKTQATFWKKEYTNAGEQWVEAKDSDQKRAKRW